MNATGPLCHTGVLALLPCYCEPKSSEACRALVHRSVCCESTPIDALEHIEGKRWGREADQTLCRYEKSRLNLDDAFHQVLIKSMVEGMNAARLFPGSLI